MRIDLPSELTIAHAAETAQDWRALLAGRPDQLVIKGDSVQRIDTAGVQLLLALNQASRQLGVSWRWDSVSDALHRACVRAGLHHLTASD